MKPGLSIVYGQPDRITTSFQTRQLAAALGHYFRIREFRVPASPPRLAPAARIWANSVRPVLRPWHDDWILYGNDGTARLSRARGRTLLYWYDAVRDWRVDPPRRSRPVDWLRYRNVVEADRVFAVSAAQVELAGALRHGAAGVHYLPVGVDCARFDPAQARPERARARFGLPPDRVVVGYLGYVAAHGGRLAGETVLEALAQLRDHRNWHGLFVGFGPALNALRARAAALGLDGRVTFTGFVEEDWLPDCLAAMDICTDTLEPGFHSLARSETKLKQYLAMGRACVATELGENVADLERGASGVLVPPGAGPLAEALAALAGDPERRTQLGARARARAVQAYDWRVLAARLCAEIGVGGG